MDGWMDVLSVLAGLRGASHGNLLHAACCMLHLLSRGLRKSQVALVRAFCPLGRVRILVGSWPSAVVGGSLSGCFVATVVAGGWVFLWCSFRSSPPAHPVSGWRPLGPLLQHTSGQSVPVPVPVQPVRWSPLGRDAGASRSMEIELGQVISNLYIQSIVS